jgi:hypothetical protein
VVVKKAATQIKLFLNVFILLIEETQILLIVPTEHWYFMMKFNRKPDLAAIHRFFWTPQALGQNSKAVHRAYAKRALMKLPSLENYEKKAA